MAPYRVGGALRLLPTNLVDVFDALAQPGHVSLRVLTRFSQLIAESTAQ